MRAALYFTPARYVLYEYSPRSSVAQHLPSLPGFFKVGRLGLRARPAQKKCELEKPRCKYERGVSRYLGTYHRGGLLCRVPTYLPS